MDSSSIYRWMGYLIKPRITRKIECWTSGNCFGNNYRHLVMNGSWDTFSNVYLCPNLLCMPSKCFWKLSKMLLFGSYYDLISCRKLEKSNKHILRYMVAKGLLRSIPRITNGWTSLNLTEQRSRDFNNSRSKWIFLNTLETNFFSPILSWKLI